MHISKLLQTAPLFSYFSQPELQIFEKAFSVNTYEDGHEFTKEGERHRTIFLIFEGDVEVTRHRPGIAGYDLIKKWAPGKSSGWRRYSTTSATRPPVSLPGPSKWHP